MNNSDLSGYLNRIELSNCDASFIGLMQLQEHHTEIIPFENLDIIVGREILLDYDSLYDKVISKGRGGYCFELNVLYANLLESMGFITQAVLARVWFSNPINLPPRNHLANLVEIEGKTYITDVGFGGLVTRVPLDINDPSPVDDKDGVVRIIKLTEHEFMLQRQTEQGWSNQYSFEDKKISHDDINIANFYMSSHANSHLIEHKCVGRNTKDGRIGLFNNKFTIREGMKVVDKRRIDYGAKWLELLESDFSISLDFTDKELDVLLERE